MATQRDPRGCKCLWDARLYAERRHSPGWRVPRRISSPLSPPRHKAIGSACTLASTTVSAGKQASAASTLSVPARMLPQSDPSLRRPAPWPGGASHHVMRGAIKSRSLKSRPVPMIMETSSPGGLDPKAWEDFLSTHVAHTDDFEAGAAADGYRVARRRTFTSRVECVKLCKKSGFSSRKRTFLVRVKGPFLCPGLKFPEASRPAAVIVWPKAPA